MEGMRIKRLKCLKDTDNIDFNSLTLLIGNNSSGKSSFIRTLPLLKQSIENKTQGPILWYGDYVDYGNFKEALKTNEKNKTINFQFRINLKNLLIPKYVLNKEKDTDVDVEAELSLTHDNNTYLSGMNISIFNDNLKITYDANNKIKSCYINETKYSIVDGWNALLNDLEIFPYISSEHISKKSKINLWFILFGPSTYAQFKENKILKNLYENIKSMLDKRVKENNILNIIRKIRYSSQDNFYNHLQNLSNYSSWHRSLNNYNEHSTKIEQIREYSLLLNLNRIIFSINRNINETILNTIYIGPSRATTSRYYRIQDLSVDDVAHNAQNFPMILRNLSKQKLDNLNSFIYKLFGFEIDTHKIGDQIEIRIHDSRKNSNFNLADIGFGYSQILPIITQLWLTQNKKDNLEKPILICLEQPELHLHPSYQAKVAQMLSHVIQQDRNNKIKLLIETHSDIIVNEIGKQIHQNNLAHDKVNIVLFDNKHDMEETQIKFSYFANEGHLVNWPYGFFEP